MTRTVTMRDALRVEQLVDTVTTDGKATVRRSQPSPATPAAR